MVDDNLVMPAYQERPEASGRTFIQGNQVQGYAATV